MADHFHVGLYAEAVELVRRYHYTKRPPSNVQCVGTLHEPGGLFGDYGRAVAACFLSIPPTRWSEPVWELSRLVRDDKPRNLSKLVSKTCKFARNCGIDLLVSFADSSQGHHGGIYQACSWAYAGKRNRTCDGIIIDGEFIPGRSANSKFGTRSATKLTELLGKKVSGHFDEGKHVYWKALNKSGINKAGRLGLCEQDYPKPDLFIAPPAQPVQEGFDL